LATSIEARPVQIIHTNDLHSHMDYAGSRRAWGGYAAVKAVIDRIRNTSAARGIPTLVLDAGDFSEGTHFFLADEGAKSWQAMNEIGYDAVALGNHDYQIGNFGLEHILSRIKPNHPVLAANYEMDQKYSNARAAFQKAAEFERDGIKIAVLGLTINELFFRWTAKPDGNVSDPISVAKKLVPDLKKRNDFVIALTHLGTTTDEKLGKSVSGIDVIVGGHSHTALSKPVYIKRGLRAPAVMVQAGEHGKFVGNLLLDLEPGLPPRVIRYKLEKVIPLFTGEDQNILRFVKEAREAVNTRFGPGWLDEVIGFSKTPLRRPSEGTTKWSAIFPMVFRAKTGADVGLDAGEFYGPTQTAGEITREKLIRFYPRVFDIQKPDGWTIWTVKLQGKFIIEMIRQSAKRGLFYNLDGITYRVTKNLFGEIKIDDFKIGGKKVSLLKIYKIATSEGLGRGLKEGSWATNLLTDPKDSGVPIWRSVEERLRLAANPIP
jgi:5'-nucleotidase / UDP-sugar diphosphatase